MANLPAAKVSIAEVTGGFAGMTGFCVVIGCAEKNADGVPRVYASVAALLETHGYSAAADYVALHIEATRKPVLFVPAPTATPGTIGRQNDEGVAGTSSITVAAGANGVLEEVDGVVRVVTGGTIGQTGIVLEVSMDGGRTRKRVRLGTQTSYAVPYVGIVLNFGAGTLVADDEFTFSTTPPMWDGDGVAAARVALAGQQKLARSWLVVEDLPNSTFAGYVTTATNAYETANQRFVYARAQVRDRIPLAKKSKTKKQMTGAPTLTFAEVGATDDTVTRSAGSWIADGFAVGDVVTIAGSVSNNVTGAIKALSATVLTFDDTDLIAEGPVAGCTVVGSEGLTFAEVGGSGDTITRSGGSWFDDGFAVGDEITIAGTSSNDVTGTIADLSSTVLTLDDTDLADEVCASHVVSIEKGETMSQWVSAMDAEFDAVDAQKRIDLGLGRARKLSPITGWALRRPAQWAASIREYQHDLQVPTWRKDDGPLDGWDLEDAGGVVVEYDERTVGGALAARFTCLRTFGNGPNGAFVALSLTRADEGSLLSRTHNLAVANLACTVTHRTTESCIGQVLVLNDDGTATQDALSVIEQRVNSQLEIALLAVGLEGQRASSAVWRASSSDVLNVPGAKLTGVLDLRLNGTLEQIETSVLVQ